MMIIDENTFFREATLRICGSLDVKTFLHQSLLYIRQFIPADTVALSHFYPEEGKQLALAMASSEGGKLLNLVMPMPSKLRTRLDRDIQVSLLERVDTHPITSVWVEKGFLEKGLSGIAIRLTLQGEYIGTVTFFAKGINRFTPEHADLLAPLREPFAIAMSNSLRYQELLELKELLVEDKQFLQQELQHIAGEEIIGADFGLRKVMEMLRQVAPLSSPVLLLGETGTGKEILAGAIHTLSPRKDGPFIKVNCGAIPENLIDSELFGYEKGAFTGALSRKRGRFERASGGTIFLDEVGELHPEAQVRLLRVLQEREIERVGGTAPVHVDIRIIAATHRDLEQMIREGTFREDLYFRLHVFPIAIPPLRERRGDIASLVQYFIHKKSRDLGLKKRSVLVPSALQRLENYVWPGNIRELANTVERELILTKEGPLTFQHIELSRSLQERDTLETPPESFPESFAEAEGELTLDAAMTTHIRRVLTMTKGRIEGTRGAAHVLGMNPSTLRQRMRKLGIPFGRKTKPK